MNWQDIWILYRFEVRAALRERTIILNGILIPILLYPFLLWAVFTGITFVQGQTEGFVSRVILNDLPSSHAVLETRLEEDPNIELLDSRPAAEATAAVEAGEVDALVEFFPARGEAQALAENFRFHLTADSSNERSAKARERLMEELDRYRDEWLREEAVHLDVDEAEWQVFTLRDRNTASRQQMGALVLGLTLPIFFVVMVAVASIHPAIDATAGERERNTWETTMTLATSRISIVTAKYLYVTTFGVLAGALNLTAMTVSMGAIFAPLLQGGESGVEFAVPLRALPLLLLGAVLLAGFIAAGMMIFAAFARTFREGQSMITPFYLLTLLPVMFLGNEGLELTTKIALMPIVNVAVMVREALNGTFHGLQIAVTLVSNLTLVALCLWLATFILRFEDVVVGSYSGNLGKFLRQRLLKARPGVSPAEGS